MGLIHHILLVEDSDDDAFFMQRAITRGSGDLQLHRVTNGQGAMDYLLGLETYADRAKFPLPELIFLDLKMPICDGFDFLAWKRSVPGLTCIPTIVMTSSNQERDIRRSYDLGAHSYTTKVSTTEALCQRLADVKSWWFQNCLRVAPAV